MTLGIFRVALVIALFSGSANAESPGWFVDPTTGVAHHEQSGGFCPALLGGLPRTAQTDAKGHGDSAICSYGPPSQPDAQRISIQRMPDVERNLLDEIFRQSLLERFPGSTFELEVERICQSALTNEMRSPLARCMAIGRDGFSALLGFHVIDGWSIQPMFVTSGKGISEKNTRLIGTTFAELFKTEEAFMRLPVR